MLNQHNTRGSNTVEIRALLTKMQLDLFMNEVVSYMETRLMQLIDSSHITPLQCGILTEQLAHHIALEILQAHANGESTY